VRPRPLVMAHRGSSARAPENTLAAFRLAIEEGADLVETDLHVTRDDVFVCVHDATLERTGGVPLAVADATFEELRRHPVGCGMPAFAGELVPSLADLTGILPGDRGLALELKSDRFLEPELCRGLASEVRAAGVFERTVFLSFSAARCDALRAVAPDAWTGIVTMTHPFPDLDARLLGPLWLLLLVNPLYPWLAHRRGRFVAPLDDRPDRLLWYYRLIGCDAVLTNDPATTLRKLGRAPPLGSTGELTQAGEGGVEGGE